MFWICWMFYSMAFRYSIYSIFNGIQVIFLSQKFYILEFSVLEISVPSQHSQAICFRVLAIKHFLWLFIFTVEVRFLVQGATQWFMAPIKRINFLHHLLIVLSPSNNVCFFKIRLHDCLVPALFLGSAHCCWPWYQEQNRAPLFKH